MLYVLTIQNIGLKVNQKVLLGLFAAYKPTSCIVYQPQASGITVADIIFPTIDQAKLCQSKENGKYLPNEQVISFASAIKCVEDTNCLQLPEKISLPSTSGSTRPAQRTPPKVRN